MRVLLIEDSRRLREYIGKALTKSGYAADVASDGQEGLYSAEINDYDVIVLDVMLPKLDGFRLLQRLRSQGKTTPVLMLTAKDTVEDRVYGLQQGADDYLVKPFALKELLARLQALVRRQYDRVCPRIEVGHLLIDTSSRTVTRERELVDLTSREYMLLQYLALRKGEVVSRTDIEHHIYDDRREPMSNVVDVAISRLRRRIDIPGKPSLIQTRRGMGYVLGAPEP